MDFFDEVQYEAKIDKVNFFFQKYLNMIILSLCLILIVFTGYYFWQKYSQNLTVIVANDYDKALEAEGSNRVKLLEKIVKNKNNIFKVMSHLKLAEITLQNQDFNKAAYHYREIFKDNSSPQEHADYAELMFIKTNIITNKNKNAENILLLVNYINSQKVFRNLARLYLSSLYIDVHNNKEAQNQLNYLLTNEYNGDTSYIMPLAKELMKQAKTN